MWVLVLMLCCFLVHSSTDWVSLAPCYLLFMEDKNEDNDVQRG